MSPKNSNKAFTIIELLVVISIIGLLSSVILVSVSNARDKGRISSGIQFSSSLYQTKGLELVGEWKFDEGSGNTVTDSSGRSNNGTIGGTNNWSSDIPTSNHGKSLYLDGSSYVTVPDSTLFDINRRGFSYALWIKPASTPANGSYNMLIGKVAPYFAIYWWSGSATLVVTIFDDDNLNGCNSDTGNPDYKFLFGNKTMQPNRWYYVVVTLDESGYIKTYVDGKLDKVSSNAYTHPCNFISTADNFVIGAWAWASYSYKFNGWIDEARFYNGAVTYSQVQKFYAESKARHQNMQSSVKQVS